MATKGRTVVKTRGSAGKSADELAMMRNSIYARWNYCFNQKKYQDAFYPEPWYHCWTDSLVYMGYFYDEDNLRTIKAEEKKIRSVKTNQ